MYDLYVIILYHTCVPKPFKRFVHRYEMIDKLDNSDKQPSYWLKPQQPH